MWAIRASIWPLRNNGTENNAQVYIQQFRIWHKVDTVGKPLNRAFLERSLCVKTSLNFVGQRGLPTVSNLVKDEFL